MCESHEALKLSMEFMRKDFEEQKKTNKINDAKNDAQHGLLLKGINEIKEGLAENALENEKNFAKKSDVVLKSSFSVAIAVLSAIGLLLGVRANFK